MDKLCWVCEQGPDAARVPATHEGCEHLTTLVPEEAARYGLCDQCFDAGPCDECRREYDQ